MPDLITLPVKTPDAQNPDDLATELLADAAEPTEAQPETPPEPEPETQQQQPRKKGRPRKTPEIPDSKKPSVVLPEKKTGGESKQDQPGQSGPTDDERKAAAAAALAKILTMSVTGSFVAALGDDLKPEPAETANMEAAWTAYLMTRKEVEPPAWALVLISTACYAAPKMTRPTAKEKLFLIAGRLKSFLSPKA